MCASIAANGMNDLGLPGGEVGHKSVTALLPIGPEVKARISILKRGFLGTPMRAKGFANRELALAWGVLTHNLWMLARMKKVRKKDLLRQAA